MSNSRPRNKAQPARKMQTKGLKLEVLRMCCKTWERAEKSIAATWPEVIPDAFVEKRLLEKQ
jgi:hypothetical protein